MSCKTLITLALLGAAATAAQAQTLDRVEVLGQKVRADVSATCSQLRETLPQMLQPAIWRSGHMGSYTVLFDLKDNTVSDVRMQSMPLEYRRPVAAALRYARCQDAASAQQAQRFGFILDVVPESRMAGAPARLAVALRALP